MEKSAGAFRTISEVADDLDLPQHVLRFWETRFPQIRPLKRAGGRRYYRPADVALLRTIRKLLYDEGYTIKGVQRLLKEQGAKGVRAGAVPMPVDLAALGPDFSSDAETPATGEDESDEAIENGPPAPQAEINDPSFNLSQITLADSAALRAALAMIEECERILGALRP